MAGVSLSGSPDEPGGPSPGGPGPEARTAARHAIYFVPGDDSALGRFGAAVLGRWPDGRAVPDAPKTPPCRAGRVERPARYGFHATLKAPFALAAGATADALAEALGRFARARAPVALEPLEIRHGGGSTVLGLAGGRSGELDALAGDVVRTFEPFRAPLDEAARARRAPERLDPAARARLERWGYPWVFDGFEFHLTLGAGGPARTAVEDAAWLGWLDAVREREGAVGPERLDRLALCSQDAPDRPFVRRLEVALSGTGPAAELRPDPPRHPSGHPNTRSDAQ